MSTRLCCCARADVLALVSRRRHRGATIIDGADAHTRRHGWGFCGGDDMTADVSARCAAAAPHQAYYQRAVRSRME